MDLSFHKDFLIRRGIFYIYMLGQSWTVAHERRNLPSAPIIGDISMAFGAEILSEGFGHVLALGP